MRHYAGLDVSLEETAICVVDEAGRIVKEARVPSEPEALVGFFEALGRTVERIGLEACALAAWLHEGLYGFLKFLGRVLLPLVLVRRLGWQARGSFVPWHGWSAIRASGSGSWRSPTSGME